MSYENTYQLTVTGDELLERGLPVYLFLEGDECRAALPAGLPPSLPRLSTDPRDQRPSCTRDVLLPRPGGVLY